MRVDFIIVGQGIAGSLLCRHLMQTGADVLVIDENSEYTSSKVASGITNPVTGRRLVKTWLADELIPYTHQVYNSLQQEFGQQFFHPMPISRVFDSVKAFNDWSVRADTEDYQAYLSNGDIIHYDNSKIDNPHGVFEINGGSRLNMRLFLNAFAGLLKMKEHLWEERLEVQQLEFAENSVRYKDVTATKIIFCDGSQVTQLPWFADIRMFPAKGECLLAEIPELNLDHMLKKEVLLVPFYEKDIYYVGATHEHHYTTPAPTDKGKSQLLEGLNDLIKLPYRVVEHWSGLRPVMRDRRPVMGFLKEKPVIGIFNGMGTKGVSLSAYFANHFTQHITAGRPLMKEVDLARFLL